MTTIAPPTSSEGAHPPAERLPTGSARKGLLLDALFKMVCQGAALLVILLFALLIGVLVLQALPAMRAFGPAFLWTDAWVPERDINLNSPTPSLGALSFIYGTVVTSLIAMALALPLGVGTAAFLSEIATPTVRRVGAFLIELLAAIPSVVYGFWGLFFLAPFLQRLYDAIGGPNVGGQGIFCAGVILAIMIVPYITAISFDVCQAVPRSQREGSLALGSTRWQMIWTVILPYARPGILGGCILALGRALGETMAVVMLIGNWKNSIILSFFAKGSTVSSVIAQELNSTPSDLKRSALIELGLILLLVTVVINGTATMLIRRLSKPRSRGLFGKRWGRSVAPSETGGATNGQPEFRFDYTRYTRRAQSLDRVMTGVLGTFLVLTCVPLFLILGYISFRGFRSVDWTFFTNTPFDEPRGLGQAVLGTGMLVLMASLWAVPIGIFAAIFLVEYRKHRLVPVVRFVNELLGGVPSIIIGILGYALLVRPIEVGGFKMPSLGFSGWAGAFALGVLMIPVVMRSAEESLKLVPRSLREASYALGGAYWQTVLRVTLPAAMAPIVTGILLAMARIAGETAPLLLTAGSRNIWTTNPSGQMPYLTYYIYNWSLEGGPEQERLAWAGAFVLLSLVMLMNIGVRLLAGKRAVNATRAG